MDRGERIYIVPVDFATRGEVLSEGRGIGAHRFSLKAIYKVRVN